MARRSFLEIAFLLVFIGGFVQYGSTKGTRRNSAVRPSLRQETSAQSSLEPVDLSTVDSAEGLFGAYTNAVTNLCFTGISPACSSVYLRVAWPPDFTPPVDVFAQSELTADVWTNVGRVSSADAGGLVAEVPRARLPASSAHSMFFTLGSSEDTDGDGLTDVYERLVSKTLPGDPDTDGDGLPDGWEAAYGLNPTNGLDGVGADSDGDGLTNGLERVLGTHPRARDTDGDGIDDYQETGGIVAESTPQPWTDFMVVTNLTSLFGDDSADCVAIRLDSPACILGEAYGYLSLDVSGIVYFDRTNGVGHVHATPSSLGMLGSASVSNDVALAPCWTDLRLSADSPPSRISIVASAGVKWIEYANMRRGGYDGNPISFRVSIPTSDTPFAAFQYLCPADCVANAVIGTRAANGNLTLQCDGDAALGSPGQNMLYVDFGYGTNPTFADTDLDGVPDGDEIGEGLNPCQPDTDGDGLDDGWECAYRSCGFDPLADNRRAGGHLVCPDADMDGDGLSNADECAYGTDPNCRDSDGDGVEDGLEVSQESDPGDGTDGGIAGSRPSVPFTFGDPSSSHSEKYRLELTPVSGPLGDVAPRSLSWTDTAYGEVETKYAPLKPGWKYEARFFHAGTDSGYKNVPRPDFDYMLSIGDSGSSIRPVVLDDPDGLFCTNNLSETFAGEGKVAAIYVFGRPRLVFDWDRNGAIDSADVAKADDATKTFRFWVNDDTDSGDVSEDGTGDVPGASTSTANCANAVVDGRRDLLDFTPVWIDFSQVFPISAPLGIRSRFSWKLRSPCLKAVWTSLRRDGAGRFLHEDVSGTGSDLSTAVENAAVTGLSGDGVVLPSSFVSLKDGDPDGGVFLVEGCAEGSELVLEGWIDGKKTVEGTAHVNVSSVEKMYRWLGLRSVCGGTDVDPGGVGVCDPPNWPDAERDGRHFVFVHGYNVNADSARAWAAEMFKRLWQSGLNSRFTAVDWFGNESQMSVLTQGDVSPDYYINVQHALDTAPVLVQRIGELAGENKIVLAHSLGNIVVSEAAVKYGLVYTRYFMLNAAVAMEAYDSDAMAEEMIDHDWVEIPRRLRASEWFTLFPSGDRRRSLNWRGRYVGILNTINCYSPTENVLTNPGMAWGGVWGAQELFKGTFAMTIAPGNSEGGWGFSNLYDFDTMSTYAFTDDELITRPVFKFFDDSRLHETNGLSSYPQTNLNKVLGDGIPATSFAAGANALPNGSVSNSLSFDEFMANIELWPDTKRDGPALLWEHSDLKNIAYFFVFPLFNFMIEAE